MARHGDAGVVHKLGQSLVLQPHRQFVPLTAAIPQAIDQQLDQGPEPLFRIAEVLDSQQGCGPFGEPDRIGILGWAGTAQQTGGLQCLQVQPGVAQQLQGEGIARFQKAQGDGICGFAVRLTGGERDADQTPTDLQTGELAEVITIQHEGVVLRDAQEGGSRWQTKSWCH